MLKKTFSIIILMLGCFPIAFTQPNKKVRDVSICIVQNPVISKADANYVVLGTPDVSSSGKNDSVYLSHLNNNRYTFNISGITTCKWSHLNLPGFSFSFAIESGDTINILHNSNRIAFSGNNVAKLNCQYELQSLVPKLEYSDNPDEVRSFYNKIDITYKKSVKILELYKKKISAKAYDMMYYQNIMSYESLKMEMEHTYKASSGSKAAAFRKAFRDYRDPIFNKAAEKVLIKKYSFLSDDLYPGIADFVFFFYKYGIVGSQSYNPVKTYKSISTNYIGILRENILAALFNNWKDTPGPEFRTYLDSAIHNKYINRKNLVEKLIGYRESNGKGAMAYNFSLSDDKGKIIKLSDFRGKVVLLDFWYTECGPCAIIHPYVEKIRKEYEGKEFVLISVSIDKQRSKWINSIKQGIRTTEKNINIFTNGNGENDPIIKNYRIEGYPTLVLIDKRGELMDRPEHPGLNNGQDIRAKIDFALSSKY